MIFVSEPFYLSMAPQAAAPKRAHSPRRRPSKSSSSPTKPKRTIPRFTPPTDIFETPTTYNVEVALPGIKKDQVEVEWVDDNKLVIKARNQLPESEERPEEGNKENEEEPPVKRRKVWLSERTYGEFVKEVKFPENIDLESTSVRLDAGLLHVEVKKMEKKKRGKVQVEYIA